MLHSHQGRLLPRNELVTTHAVVLLDYPPAFLNVSPIIHRPILVRSGKCALLRAHQESSERPNLLRLQMHVRHAQLFRLRLDLALIPNIRLREFVLEKSEV